MSRLGELIARWLASGPGLITGETPEEMWHIAHDMAGCHPGVPLDEFKAALDRAGYRPQQRRKFLDGKVVGDTHVLALPERTKGM